MLLSDVIEFEDTYTAQHSRSVVDLVNEVAEELRVPSDDRQELEFAAMLHDVGKIAIPKAILNKPAALTDQEFEIMKTHTIEGQFMLDRVEGFSGAWVRSFVRAMSGGTAAATRMAYRAKRSPTRPVSSFAATRTTR